MFRASLCPSSGEQDRVLLHMVFCTGCAGCGWLWLCGVGSWAVCTVWRCTQCTTQLHTTTANHNQHNQCRTPYAVVHSLVLLMMGIMMPETCWDRSLIINIGLVVTYWFISLHHTFMMRGHKDLKQGVALSGLCHEKPTSNNLTHSTANSFTNRSQFSFTLRAKLVLLLTSSLCHLVRTCQIMGPCSNLNLSGFFFFPFRKKFVKYETLQNSHFPKSFPPFFHLRLKRRMENVIRFLCFVPI